MSDQAKSKKQLISELSYLRRQVEELQAQQEAVAHPSSQPSATRQIAVAQEEAEQQQAVEQSQTLDFFQHAGVSLSLIAADGTIAWANRACAELLGFAPEELHGRHIAELLVDQQVMHSILQRMARNERIYAYQARLRSKSGAHKDVQIDISPHMRGEYAQHSLCLFHDISGHRRAEDARHAGVALHEAIEASMLAGVAAVDLHGRQTYVNPAFCDMVGWREDELVGAEPPFVYWPEEELDTITSAHHAMLAGRPPIGLELRLKRRDEQRFDALIMISPIRDAQGVITGWLTSAYDITARKAAERALQESERKLRLIAENSSEVIYAYDLEGRLLYVNPAVKQLTGYSVEELTQNNFISWMHPEDATKVSRLWSELLQGSSFTDQEFRIVCRDGQTKWLLSSWGPLYNESGERIGIVGHDRDISDRKKAEESLRFLADGSAVLASSLDYETTLATLATLAVPSFADCCIVDILTDERTLRRVAVSAADANKLSLLQELQEHYAPDRDSPHPAAKVLRDKTAVFFPAIDQETIREHTRDARHFQLIRQLGPRSLISVPLVAREHTLGVLTFATAESGRRYQQSDLAVAEDLARRAAIAIDNARLYQSAQQAQQENRSHAERLHIQAEASRTFAAASLDLDALLDAITRHIGEVLGDACLIRLLSPDGAWLNPLTIYDTDDETRSFVQQMLAAAPQRSDEGLTGRVMQSGRPVLIASVDKEQLRATVKPEYRHYLDHVSIHSLVIVPLRLPDRVIGTLAIARHTVPEAYTEDDLALVQDLADRAALAVDNARLYREVKQALHIRDQFLSLAAHELKTPMTTILGQSQLLQRRFAASSNNNRREHHSLRILVDQVRRLYRLINSLLDLGRIQESRLTIEQAELDLAGLVRQIADEIEPAFAQHQLELDIPEHPCFISGDRLRLEQVLQNLLHNALKYSLNGGVIRVRLEQRSPQLLLSVSDQGMGIPADELPKVFDRFYRARNVNMQQLSGMGIGLHVVKEIVTLHGGSISVESTEGQGTCFTISLPGL